MNRINKPAVLLALFGLCVLFTPSAQARESTEAEGLAPRRVMIQAASSDAASKARLDAIAAFFRVELEASTRFVLVETEAEADLVLSLTATRSGSSWALDLAVRLSDGSQGKPYQTSLGELGVGQAQPFLKKTALALDAAYPPLAIQVTEVVKDVVISTTETVTTVIGATLTIEGPPGVILYLPDGTTATLPEDGRWVSEQPQNTSFAYRVELPGHMPQNRVVYIGENDITDLIAMEPLRNWNLGGDIRYLNLLFVPQAEWYPVPGRFFIGLGLESSYLAIIAPGSDEKSRPSINYLDLQLGAGLWLSRPDALFRSGLTLGLAGRVDIAKGLFRFSDYAPASLRLGLRISWEVFRRVSVFAEANSRLALILVPEGADPSKVLSIMPAGFSIPGGLFYLEAPTIFVGGRLAL